MKWMVMLVMLLTGCASTIVAEQSHDRKLYRADMAYRAECAATGQDYRKTPFQVGEALGTFYFGVDLLSWSTLTEQPIKQTLAALVDAGLLYLAKKTVDHYSDKGGAEPSPSPISITINCGGPRVQEDH